MSRTEKRKHKGRFKKRGKSKTPQSVLVPKSESKSALTVQQAIDLGRQHHHLGDLPKAESIYRQILHAEPNQPDVIHLLGVIAYQVGKHDVAVKLIGKAVTLNPEFAEAHCNLGNALQEQGNLDDAAASYQKALVINPDFAEAHNNLGAALKDLGLFDEAIGHYKLAISLNSTYAEAHYNLGTAYKEQMDIDAAIASYQEALSINPLYVEAHNNLGSLLQDIGELDGAELRYRDALTIAPNYVPAHVNLGKLSLVQGKLDQAVTSFRVALSFEPNLVEAHYSLGIVLQVQSKLDEAVSSYRNALSIEPDLIDALNNLGVTYDELGEHGKALDCFHSALTIQPDNFAVWNNFKFAAMAFKYCQGNSDHNSRANRIELSDAASSSIGYALHQFYLASFRPDNTANSYAHIFEALPSIAEQTIPVSGVGSKMTENSWTPEKMVALLHFGRSGTGLLHSLIDDHPEISTLPSIYLRGYFNAGVWDKISADGWRKLPERFADEFAVLFDATSPKPIPSKIGEMPFAVGNSEGTTSVGQNRDKALSLDCDAFCLEALTLLEQLETIDPMTFFGVIHKAFDVVNGSKLKKNLCFYHIHNPDSYAKSNFLRYAPKVQLLMMVREPIQSCESWICISFENNDYGMLTKRIVAMLFDIDQIAFRMQNSVGVRLEDLKTRSTATLKALCSWLGVENSATLFEMTAQGKIWWGNPTDQKFDADQPNPFEQTSIKRPLGRVFGEKDQFILQTLFYPFSVRFGYKEPNPSAFQNDLDTVRPLLDEMLDFEKKMAKRSNINHGRFMKNGAYVLFHAALVERWNVLNELGDYPHMLSPLTVE